MYVAHAGSFQDMGRDGCLWVFMGAKWVNDGCLWVIIIIMNPAPGVVCCGGAVC